MIEAVRRYDGYVVQSTGDGIFALFGAPVAHEDHAQRSLYTALRLHEEMRRYSDRLRGDGRPPIQVRAGVNTGEVVVRSIRTERSSRPRSRAVKRGSLGLRSASRACMRGMVIGPEAGEKLGRLYSSFTEGFGTPDLREAKILLAELQIA
jgi:class 3 adenylate cyclase